MLQSVWFPHWERKDIEVRFDEQASSSDGGSVLLRPRVFGLAPSYADCNNAAHLKDDSMLKLLPGRDPRDGPNLASQPTLSRFENQVTWPDLAHLGEALARTVTERQKRRRQTARLITLACDPTHGSQQSNLFNAFYDTYGYRRSWAA